MGIRAVTSLLLIAPHTLATTIDIPLDYPTIQAGIDAALDGDTVRVHPGTYFETEIGYDGKAIVVTSLDPDDSLTVAATVVSGGGVGRPFHFRAGEDSTSVLVGLLITAGYDDFSGGGIACVGASPTIDRCRVVRNQLAEGAWVMGGGIYCGDSAARIIRTTIADNTVAHSLFSSFGAGVACEEGAPTLIDCMIERNRHLSGSGFGGGLHASGGDLLLEGVTVRGNFATGDETSDGGGICLERGIGQRSFELRTCTISGNEAGDSGGGISVSGWSQDRCTIWNCTISDNWAITGGGIASSAAGKDIEVTRCTINNNWADGHGAGLFVGSRANMVLQNCVISWNRIRGGPRRVTAGGGIYVLNGATVVRQSTIAYNSGLGAGGGIYSVFEPVTVLG